MTLFDRKIILVTGKGGVGRSTVSSALALAASRRGKKACVVELYGNGVIAEQFGLGERSYDPRPIAKNVDVMSLTPMECLADFGRRKMRMPFFARALFENRVLGALVDGVPGLHDLFQLGKLTNLLMEPGRRDPRYDLVVIDAPATGHGLTLLYAGRALREMTRVGRFSDEARAIEELFLDPVTTAIVVVALPALLPVNESLELVTELGPEARLVRGVVLNRVAAEPLNPDWDALREIVATADPALADVGDQIAARTARQAAARARLREAIDSDLGTDIPIAELPLGGPQELSVREILRFGDLLAKTLGGRS